MNVKSFWVSDLSELKAYIETLDFSPTLAFVFPDVSYDIKQIQNIFNEANIKLFGATSSGEIIDNQSKFGGISGLIMDLSPENFEVFFELDKGDAVEVGRNIAKKAMEKFNDPSLIIAAPGFSDGDAILEGLFSILPQKTRVIGGFSGDDLSFDKAKIFDNHNIAGSETNSLVSVVLNGQKVLIDGYAVNGWKIISDVHTITLSDGNVVYQIDGRPALDVFREILQIDEDKVYDLVKKFGPRYPVLLYRYNRPPVLRHPIVVDVEQKSITFSAKMPMLATIEFGEEPNIEIINRTVYLIEKTLKAKCDDVDAVILFSCKARQLAFEDKINIEIKGVYELWNKPMAGFFTYGEIGIANDGRTDFHNETCNVLVMKQLN